MADPMREARKHGTDSPHEPTDEFVVHAFAEGARELWPDSRDPGWHVTFRRWIERRDAAARAEDAARLAEVWDRGFASGVRGHHGNPYRPALGVTAPTASEAGA